MLFLATIVARLLCGLVITLLQRRGYGNAINLPGPGDVDGAVSAVDGYRRSGRICCSWQPFRLIGAHRLQHSGGESLRK